MAGASTGLEGGAGGANGGTNAMGGASNTTGGTNAAGGSTASGGKTTGSGGSSAAGGKAGSGGTSAAGGKTAGMGGAMGSGGTSMTVTCEPGARRCQSTQPQVCATTGDRWNNDGVQCANAYTCNATLGTCESNKSVRVVGGAFFRGNDSVTSTTAYPATISSFAMDKYEATVNRFRSFVTAVVGGGRPSAGAGKHAHLSSGSGLGTTMGGFEAGWSTTWNQYLPATKATWDESLACGGAATWTSISGNESKALNCLNWYQAYAFCIWDGGFLPSEAEWNYLAAGGAQQRYYPWSVPSDTTTITAGHAVYLGVSQVADVGTKSPLGDGYWLQRDLTGNLWEWTLDYFAPYNEQCRDCANVTSVGGRVIRGGGLYTGTSELASSYRASSDPTDQLPYLGVRCARTP